MILYAPVPVQVCFTLNHAQFARIDARFADPERVSGDPQTLVQDSSALLTAHLTLRTLAGEYQGRPEGHAEPRLVRLHDWRRSLHLGGNPTPLTPLEALARSGQGVAYTFRTVTPGPGGEDVMLLRQYALNDWFDRLEFEFLIQEGLPGVDLLQGHTLDGNGALSQWVASATALPY